MGCGEGRDGGVWNAGILASTIIREGVENGEKRVSKSLLNWEFLKKMYNFGKNLKIEL